LVNSLNINTSRIIKFQDTDSQRIELCKFAIGMQGLYSPPWDWWSTPRRVDPGTECEDDSSPSAPDAPYPGVREFWPPPAPAFVFGRVSWQ